MPILVSEDDFWNPGLSSQPFLRPPPQPTLAYDTFTDDEIQSGLKNFYLEHDEFWTAPQAVVESIVWTPRVFQIDDEMLSIYTPANYYVAAPANGGNDSNPGTITQPWATVANLNNKFLPPGSTVYFHGGDTFTQTGAIGINASPLTIGAGNQVNISINQNGPAPVTFTSYATGKATLQFNGDTCGFIVNSTGFTTFDSLNIKGDSIFRTSVFSGTPATTLLRSGVNLTHSGGGATYSNHTVSKCKISGFYGGGLIGINGNIGYDSGNFGNITLTANELTDTIWRGIDSFQYRAPFPTVSGIIVTNNYFHDIQGTDPATISNFDSATGAPQVTSNWDMCLFAGNLITNNMSVGGGGYGIGLGYNTTRTLIQGNICAYTQAGTGLEGDSGSMEINAGSNQVIVQFNLLHDNYGTGLSITNDIGNTTTNIVARFNVVAHCNAGPTTASGNSIVNFGLQQGNAGCKLQHIWFYNNVVVDNPTRNTQSGSTVILAFGSQTGGVGDQGTLDDFHYYNNILYTTSTSNVFMVDDLTPNNRTNFFFGGNDYVVPNGGTLNIAWNGTTYNTLAAWVAAAPTPADATGITLDPSSLTNATGYTQDVYYKLLAGSMCVGEGVNLATTIGANWWDPYNFASLPGPVGAAIAAALASARDYFGNAVPSAYGSGTTYYPIGMHQPANVVMYESFGEVTAPALPSTGWASWSTNAPNFVTSTTQHWADSPNSLRHNTATFDENWTTAADNNNGDAQVSIKFRFETISASFAQWQISLRDDGSSGNRYVISAEPVGSTNVPGLGLYKTVSTVTSQLGLTVGASSIALATWYRMLLSAQGNSFNAYLQRLTDGLWMNGSGTFQVSKVACISQTDTSVTGSGVASVTANQGGTNLMYAGDFLFETLSTISEESDIPPLAPQAQYSVVTGTWNPVVIRDDEIQGATGLRPPIFVDQEEFWTSPNALVETSVWTANPFRDDEIQGSGGLKNFFLEQEEPSPAQYVVVVTTWNPLPFRDDEIQGSGGLVAFGRDQEEYWAAPNALIETTVWTRNPFADDEIQGSGGLLNFFLEQEEPSPWQYSVIVRPWNPVPFLDDEIQGSGGLFTFFLEQEEPSPAQYSVLISQWNPTTFTDDEIQGSGGLGNFPREQEEFWTAPNATIETIVWTPVPFTYDEMQGSGGLANFYLEQEEPSPAQYSVLIRPWSPVPFLDDEIQGSGGLFNFFLEQEEPSPAQYSVVVGIWQARPFTDDEIQGSGGLKNFYLEQEEPSPAQYSVVVTTWNPVPFLDDEIQGSGGIASFFLEQEEPSPAQYSVVVTPWRQLPFLDDEIQGSSGLANFFLEQEELSPAQYSVVTGIWQARPFSDDETGEPLGSVVSEEADIIPIEPTPGYSYVISTWHGVVFQDDDLFVPSIFLEDDGVFQRAPSWAAAWLSSLFQDDEIGGSLASLGLDDEAIWVFTFRPFVSAPVVMSDDDIFVMPIFVLEEEALWKAWVWPLAWQAAPALDEEASGSLKAFGIDQEEGYLSTPLVVTWTPNAATADEELLAQMGAPDSEDAFPPLPRMLVWALAPQPSIDDDTLARLGFDDEGIWNAQTQVILWNPAVITDEDALARLGFDDEGIWNAQTQSIVWSATVATDDELLARLGIDDDAPWTAQVIQIPPVWTIGTFIDDEGIGRPVVDDEGTWIAQYIPAPWQQRPFADDEAGVQLTSFATEDESPWLAQTVRVAWSGVVFSDDDVRVTQIMVDTVFPGGAALKSAGLTTSIFVSTGAGGSTSLSKAGPGSSTLAGT